MDSSLQCIDMTVVILIQNYEQLNPFKAVFIKRKAGHAVAA
jgi:hypothetical protein